MVPLNFALGGKTYAPTTVTVTDTQIAAYLPLNIVIFAEGDDTIMLTASPLSLEAFFKDPGLHGQFGRWERDIRAILNQVSADK